MAQVKPAIIIIPGGHLSPAFYSPTLSALESFGFEAYTLPHQTVGRRPAPAPSMKDDAAFISGEVKKLADIGREVVLIGHSYGGLPMTEAAQGLSVSERSAAGLKGGIVRLVYVAAQVREVGDSILSTNKDQWPPFLRDESQTYMSRDMPIATASAAFPEWPADKLPEATVFYQDQARSIFFGELSWPGYKYVPCTYVLTMKDAAAPIEKQKQRIAILRKYSPQVDVVEIESGHMPMATVPEKFVESVKEIVNRS